jgi:hypothetical protein
VTVAKKSGSVRRLVSVRRYAASICDFSRNVGTRSVAQAGGKVTMAGARSRGVAGLFPDLVFEQGADCPASP